MKSPRGRRAVGKTRRGAREHGCPDPEWVPFEDYTEMHPQAEEAPMQSRKSTLSPTSRRGAASRLLLGLVAGVGVAAWFTLESCQESPSSSSTNSTETSEDPEPAEVPLLAYDQGLPRGGTWRGYPSLLDFTGDGRDDIVVSNREEDGWNAWTENADRTGWDRRVEGLPRDLFYGGQDGADVDGDGDLDLILTSHTKGVLVYLNDGDMNWTDAGHPIITPSMLLDIVVADFNGDEHPDLVGIGHFNGGLNIYLGRGKGKFERLEQSSDLIGSERAFGMQVEATDIDGDGFDDIIAATSKGLKVFFTQHSDAGLSWNEYSDNLPSPEIGNSMRGLCWGDFNEDGRPEIGWCGLRDPKQPDGTVSYIGIFEWHAEEKNWQAIDSGLQSDMAYMDVKSADINNDGHLDLIAVNTLLGPQVYLGDGKGAFEFAGQIEDVYGKSKIDIGDINGDGWKDILVSLQAQKGGKAEGGVWTLLNSEDIWK